jgi:type IV fimbrial biogenesis protein FimT
MAAATLPRGRAGGFTLIELMIVIFILAILTGLSVPLFTQFTRNQRIKTASSELTYALTLARGEALKRNDEVVVEPDPEGWEFGWTVTTEVGGNDLVLLSHATPAYMDGGNRVSYLSVTGPDGVTYDGSGRLVAAVGGFEIESASGESGGAKTRCVAVELSGLPRSTVSDSGDCP